jgi:hypothetical protein
MTAEILSKRNHRKFIPVLRRGDAATAIPSWLAGKYYIDLRAGEHYDAQYQDLLSTLLGTRPTAPPVVRRLSSPSASSGLLQAYEPSAPVSILGVIADEVGEPRNDGTRGSALYKVPFRLSRSVSADWADAFVQTWNRPPRSTLMHRPGIASVHGDRIVLDGTTVEEVQKYHRDTLILCVQETNRRIADWEAKVRTREEQRQRQSAEHQRRVREVSEKIRFDE